MSAENKQVIMEKEVNNLVEESAERKSDIAEFYAGCNVLITGASGFVGKLLIDKILRSCPKVSKLFLMMRAKKGKSAEERFKEHFEDVLYDRLKREVPNFWSKVVMIHGQFEKRDLALSAEDRNLLKSTHIILHGAATVRFDEKLRLAVNINVRGTKEILLFAREMPYLKAIVHIGTAYSHCVNNQIGEVFYSPPFGGDQLLKLLDILDDETLEAITPTLIGKWPNTYAFTKTTAEDIVRVYSRDLPLCIVRPSIMIPTFEEPIQGWINNLYGPTGVVFGAGLGFLHTLHCEANNVADIIPADYVINNILAAAWDISVQYSKKPRPLELPPLPPQTPDLKSPEPDLVNDPPIYNSVSSCQNPITWGEYMAYNERYGLSTPSVLVFWYYFFGLHSNYYVHMFWVVFTHLLPALIVDTAARLTGRKPMLLNIFKKIHKFSAVIAYFCTQQWTFNNDNVLKLWDRVSPVDRKLFCFNVESLSWDTYFQNHVRGLRVYLAKDPMDTLPAAKRKYAILKVAHYTLATLVYLLGAWLSYKVLVFFYSLLST